MSQSIVASRSSVTLKHFSTSGDNATLPVQTQIRCECIEYRRGKDFLGRAYILPQTVQYSSKGDVIDKGTLKIDSYQHRQVIEAYIRKYGLAPTPTTLTTSANIRQPKDKSQETWGKRTKTKIKWGSDNTLPVTNDILSRKTQHGTFWFMFSVDNVGQLYVIARKYSGGRYTDVKIAKIFIDTETKEKRIMALTSQIDMYEAVVKWVLSLKQGISLPVPSGTVEARKSLNKKVFSDKDSRRQRQAYRAKIENMTKNGVIDAAKLPSQQLAVNDPEAYKQLVNRK